MSRLTSTMGLVVLLVLASASSVAAARPDRIALEGFGTFVMPAGLACDFDVQYEEIAFKQVSTAWIKRDGSTVGHVTGRYQIQLTNLETGASIRVSISGPMFIRINANGEITSVRGTGNWGNWFPGEHPFLTSGRMDPSLGGMQAILDSLRGHWSDVCAVLS